MRNFFKVWGYPLLALLILVVELAMNYPNLPVNIVVWITMGLLFLLMLAQSVAMSQVINARPVLRYADKYSKAFTFWAYEDSGVQGKSFKFRSTVSLLSTASESVVSTVRPNVRVRASSIHNMAIVLVENPNVTSRVGVTANKVSAKITCFTEDGVVKVKKLDARWWDEPEADLYMGDTSPKYLQLTTIAPGNRAELAIAEQFHGDKKLYAYNAESHHYDQLRNPEFEMGEGLFYARIQLSAEGMEPPKPIWVSLQANVTKDQIDLDHTEEPEWAKALKE